MNIDRPQDPFEQASYDLNQFRERRITDRRFSPRGTLDRRAAPQPAPQDGQQPGIEPGSGLN
jgi:hypothetical protein